MNCIFHKWDKWETYNYTYVYIPATSLSKSVKYKEFEGSDIRQRRICIKCDFMQDRAVKRPE